MFQLTLFSAGTEHEAPNNHGPVDGPVNEIDTLTDEERADWWMAGWRAFCRHMATPGFMQPSKVRAARPGHPIASKGFDHAWRDCQAHRLPVAEDAHEAWETYGIGTDYDA